MAFPLLVGAVFVEVFHRFGGGIGHIAGAVPLGGVELAVGVRFQESPAVDLDADALTVELLVRQLHLREHLLRQSEVVSPEPFVEKLVHAALAVHDEVSGHPLRGFHPPGDITIHAWTGCGVMKHDLPFLGALTHILCGREIVSYQVHSASPFQSLRIAGFTFLIPLVRMSSLSSRFSAFNDSI